MAESLELKYLRITNHSHNLLNLYASPLSHCGGKWNK